MGSLEPFMADPSRVGSRSASQSPGGMRGVDTGAWARVDADALPPEQRAMFVRRCSAIKYGRRIGCGHSA